MGRFVATAMPYRTKVSPELAIPEGESPAARTGAVECAGHAARSTQARCASRRRRQCSDSGTDRAADLPSLVRRRTFVAIDQAETLAAHGGKPRVVLGTGLDAQERGDLVAFLRAL